MKKILIICVNYKSYEALRKFVESVECAAKQVKDVMTVDIEVADNTNNNLGYLGGALPIYNERAQQYDFVSISNVDLLLSPDFFSQLLTIDTASVGWIAPDIYTEKINRHENPYMIARPTRRNFIIWNIIYSSTLLYRIYHTLYILKSSRTKEHKQGFIYAGHGSFMLFTKEFVASNPEIHFPGFMYGEEIYLAELTRRAHLSVLYSPNLRIANTGNISTGLVNQGRKSQWSKDSLKKIQQLFFN